MCAINDSSMYVYIVAKLAHVMFIERFIHFKLMSQEPMSLISSGILD